MARKGRRKDLTLEEELLELEQEVTECEEKIKQLTDRKKELKQIIEQREMKALYQAVLQSGKSIKEIISLINDNSQEKNQEEYQEGM